MTTHKKLMMSKQVQLLLATLPADVRKDILDQIERVAAGDMSNAQTLSREEISELVKSGMLPENLPEDDNEKSS